MKQINAEIGGSLVAEIRNGGLFLKPAEPAYILDDLLSSCTESKMQLDDEDRQWIDDEPAGKEAW